MSNKKWNKKEVTYLVDNYGKMSLEELSANLGRSVMAVRLYALRHRLDDKHQVVKENRLKKLLNIVSVISKTFIRASSSSGRPELTR